VDVAKTTYLLTMKNGDLKKVTVPSSWKVTFGPLVPGGKNGYNGHDGVALRFYAGKDQQKAVFTDVLNFRDMSIEIVERVTTTKQESYRKEGEDQGQVIIAEVQVHEWKNPDEPKSDSNKAAMETAPGGLLRLAKV
jgi:hypothetical protein